MTDRDILKSIDSMIANIESMVSNPLYDIIYMDKSTEKKVKKMWAVVDDVIKKGKEKSTSMDVLLKLLELEQLQIKWGR